MLRGWLRRRAVAAASVTGEAVGDVVPLPVRAMTAPFKVPSLASATRDYAYAIEMGTIDQLSARDLFRLRLAMGPDIWAWQYAKRLTGQRPWRAAPGVEAHYERLRVDRQMTADIATWERAISALDADAGRARLYGKPLPEPLVVPAAVQAEIDARRQAALERAAQRRGQASDGLSSPAPAVRPPARPL